MARYSGRHVRQARHGAWVKERSQKKPASQLLPTFAAIAVAGLLIGGGSLVIKFGDPNRVDLASGYDTADYPPADRDAQTIRTSRDDSRMGAAALTDPGAVNTPPSAPPAVRVPPAVTQKPKTQGNAAVISTGTCQASFYDEPQKTANGETFDPTTLTAAHKSLPFNSMVRVTNVSNGKSVVVRINDRGPFVSGRCLDLSSAAFGSIASMGLGVVNVRYDVLGPEAA